MKRKNKRYILFLMILLISLLAGFNKKPVELLNENPPLIDLGAAIHEADFGKNGNTKTQDGEPSTEEPGGNNGQTGQETQETHRTHTVRLRDEKITYDGTPFQDGMEELKRRLLKDCKEGDTVRLVDDYAEAHCYREVLAILEEVKAKKRIILSEE